MAFFQLVVIFQITRSSTIAFGFFCIPLEFYWFQFQYRYPINGMNLLCRPMRVPQELERRMNMINYPEQNVSKRQGKLFYSLLCLSCQLIPSGSLRSVRHSQPVVLCVDLCLVSALSVQTSSNNISLPLILNHLPPSRQYTDIEWTLRQVFPSLAVRSLCYHGNCLVAFTGTTRAVSIFLYFSSPASPHPLPVIFASK